MASCCWWRQYSQPSIPLASALHCGFNQAWVKNMQEKSAFVLNICHIRYYKWSRGDCKCSGGCIVSMHVIELGFTGFWCLRGSGTNPQQIRRDNCAERERHMLVSKDLLSLCHLHSTDEETGLDHHIICPRSRKSIAWPREFSLPLNYTRTQGLHIPKGDKFSTQIERA